MRLVTGAPTSNGALVGRASGTMRLPHTEGMLRDDTHVSMSSSSRSISALLLSRVPIDAGRALKLPSTVADSHGQLTIHHAIQDRRNFLWFNNTPDTTLSAIRCQNEQV